MNKKVLMIASEASGEQLGIPIIRACEAKGLNLEIAGLVGPELQNVGVRSIHDSRPLEVMGFIDPILSFYNIWQCFRAATNYIKIEKPALVILIDHASFNLRIAAYAKKHSVPVLFYVSPQVWAWREKRISKIVKLVDHMMVLFPFEVPLYQRAGLSATNIGHPLLTTTAHAESKDSARKKLSLDEKSLKVVTIMPGSRDGEVLRHTPELAKIAKHLVTMHPNLVFIVPLARKNHKPLFDKLWNIEAPNLGVKLTCNKMVHTAVRAADAVIVASGTASLEVALLERPAAVIYKTNPLSYLISKWLINIPYISLPNIILDRAVYPEFIQNRLNAYSVAKYIANILNGEDSECKRLAADLRELLKGEDPSQGAEIITRLLNQTSRA
ncbi:MAG: lipid-A-disaccharide synthase [Pseudomonadales bacterium]|nr:lipid-A-disaccharide synthase [Pseudomonadales bacterium]